jgi:hypothetical protein
MIRFLHLVFFLAFVVTPLETQTLQEYDTHLTTLRDSIASWRSLVNQIDPEKLNVSYSLGKLLYQQKSVLMQDMQVAYHYSSDVPTTNRTLSAKIELLAIVKDVHTQMDSLSEMLTVWVSQDQKLAQTWGVQLGAITNGPLNTEEQYQITAVEQFADELERRCGKP